MLLKTSTILCDHKFNQRGKVFPHEVESLAKLIKNGLVNPVTVRSAADAGITSHEWQLIAGYRRFTAATKILNWKQIECKILANCSDKEAKRVNLIENLGRKDLHPGNEMEAIIAVYGENPDISQVAQDLGMSEMWVKRRLKIKKLVKPVQEMFFDGRLSAFDLSLMLSASVEEQETLAAALLRDKAAGIGSHEIARQRGSLTRTRNRSQIQAMITRLFDEKKQPTCWRALAWAAGNLTDDELVNTAENLEDFT